MLTDSKIISLSLNNKLISPFSDTLVQPHSYDVTLGGEFIIFKSCKSEEVFDIKTSDIKDFSKTIKSDEITLQPNDFILGVTVEYFTLPTNITALVNGKSSIGRLGLLIHDAGFVDAGFSGTITLEIKNLNSFPIKLYKGMKIAQLTFFEVEEPIAHYGERGNHYKGQIKVTNSNLDKII